MKIFTITITIIFSIIFSQEDIVVFDNSDFRGKSSSLDIGEYNDIGKVTGLNDKISSIKINKGFQVIVFENGGFEGKKVVLTGDQPNLGKLDWNDKISSIKVDKYNKDSDAAIAYGDGDYKGKLLPLAVGEYNNLSKLTWLNDKISSIKINKGFQVIV
ncbi:MAG: beta/gamma crystallin-related protein, partial [Fidelibacterota bacterium]